MSETTEARAEAHAADTEAEAEAALATAATDAAARMTEAARMAEILRPDVVGQVHRSAHALDRRLRQYGAEADDVANQVQADMLADAAAGRVVDVSPAAVGGRVRRAADDYRRKAERERAAGDASDVMGEAAPTEADAEATSTRQRAAVMGRRRSGIDSGWSVDRADVLGVSEAARTAMRPAEVTYLADVDRSAMRAALDTDAWRPTRTAEHAAWAAMLAADEREMPATAPYVTGRTTRPVTVVAALPRAIRAERTALRAAERIARWARDDAERAEADAADGPGAADAAEAARMARSAWLAAALATEAAQGREARTGAVPVADIAERPIPAGNPADILGRSAICEDQLGTVYADGGPYVPEDLCKYQTATHARGSLRAARHVRWAAALPMVRPATRAALGRAARSWAANAADAVAARIEADAWALVVSREHADLVADQAACAALRDLATRGATRIGTDEHAYFAERETRAEAARLAWSDAAADRVAEAVAGRPGRPGGFWAACAGSTTRRADAARAAWLADADGRAEAERPAAPISLLAAHVALSAQLVREAAVAAALAG